MRIFRKKPEVSMQDLFDSMQQLTDVFVETVALHGNKVQRWPLYAILNVCEVIEKVGGK